MAALFLLAQTPRAGDKNSRLLVSEGAGLNDQEASAWVNDALHQPNCQDKKTLTGPNYLAVCRRVLQKSGDRAGDELLMLCNLNTKRLSEERRQSFVDRLERRMEDLKQLIESIDWNTTTALLSEQKALSDWLNRDFEDAPGVFRQRRGFLWVAVMLATIIAMGVLYYRGAFSETGPEANRSTKEKKPEENGVELFTRFLQTHAVPEAKREEAKVELAALFQMDTASLLKDEQVVRFLRSAGESKTVDPYRFLPEGKAGRLKDELETRFPKHQQAHPEEVLKARQCLAELAKIMQKYTEQSDRLNLPKINQKDYPFLSAAKKLVSDRKHVTVFEPVLPYFRPEEDDILTAVSDWIQKSFGEVATKLRFGERGTPLLVQASFFDIVDHFQKSERILRGQMGYECGIASAKGETREFTDQQQQQIQQLTEGFGRFIDRVVQVNVPPRSLHR